MYATKRKIQHLLDKATGTASTPPAPATTLVATTTNTTPPKKRRITPVPDRPSTSHSTKSTTNYPGTPSSIRPVSSHGKTTTTASKTPTYCPWDRVAFLQRLGTFRSVDLWSTKSEEIGEVVWAKRGWECIGKERVRCVSCRQEIVVRVEREEGEPLLEEDEADISEALVEKYKEMVVEGHDESCLWKKKGCDGSIYHIPLAKPSVSVPPFIARYKSLQPILDSIPENLSSPLESVPPLPETSEDPPLESHDKAIVLALFGWECEDQSIPLLTCSACFRRLGLWLFTHRSTGDNVEDDDDCVVSRLDVRGEHRDYCPWVSAQSQGGEEGWKTLEGVLKRGMRTAQDPSSTSGTPRATTPAGAKEEKENFESRLRRLKTVYFGKGKTLKKDDKKDKEKNKGEKERK